MEKKFYENPDLLIEEVAVEDILTTSPCLEDCPEDWDLPDV